MSGPCVGLWKQQTCNKNVSVSHEYVYFGVIADFVVVVMFFWAGLVDFAVLARLTEGLLGGDVMLVVSNVWS